MNQAVEDELSENTAGIMPDRISRAAAHQSWTGQTAMSAGGKSIILHEKIKTTIYFW